MPMTVRSSHGLFLIRRGTGWIETLEGKVAIQENHVVFVPSGVTHRFAGNPGDPLTLVVVDFYENAFQEIGHARETLARFRESFPTASPYLLSNRQLRAEAADCFRGMLFEQIHRQTGSALRIWCYLAELILLLVRCRGCARPKKTVPTRSVQSPITASVDWLSRNFFQPVSVGDLAASAGMSYRRFTEGFKQATGETVLSYITRSRIDYAARLMIESGNILDSAYAAGFGDIAHFYKTFKRYVGKTPKAFLDLQRQAPTARSGAI